MFSAESLASFLGPWGMGAILLSLGINIVIAITGVIPSIFITGANIILFGPIYGFFISWAGEVFGAGVSFYLYRLGFKKQTEKLTAKHSLLKRIVLSQGLTAGILIVQGRLLPFIPSGFVTLAGAISNVNFITFIIASALGKLPSLALEALVSYNFINLNENWLRLSIIILATILLIPLFKKKQTE